MDVIEVLENQSFSGLSGDDLAILERRLGARLERRRNGWAVVRMVGHVVLPTGRLLRVRSAKSPTSALLAWLSYADPTLQALAVNALVPELAGPGDLGGLLARLYIDSLLQVCARFGLTRGYHPERARSSFVRGRIDFARLIADGHDLSKIPCATWIRASDTALNRFLAAALRTVAADPCLRAGAGDGLAAAARLFEGVPAATPAALLHGRAALKHHEAPFQTTLDLARCILRHGGLGDGFEVPGLAFVVDLEQLFEKAVLRAFAEASYACEHKPVVRYTSVTDEGMRPASMIPDLICHAPGGHIVVDAKFRHGISAANLQQMVTYCFLTGARTGALILPGDRASTETHRFCAPAGASIDVLVVWLDTRAATIAAWRSNAAAMVERITQAGLPRPSGAGSIEPAPATVAKELAQSSQAVGFSVTKTETR